MFSFEDRFKCEEKYYRFGTGRRKRSILIGTTEDARTAEFLTLARVEQNWPSWKRLKVKDQQTGKELFIDMATRTINGTRVFLFPRNELTLDLWLKHVERQKILRWAESATPDEKVIVAKWIAEEAESGFFVWHAGLADQAIQMHLPMLGLKQLRMFAEMLGHDGDPASVPSKAANVFGEHPERLTA